MASSILIIGGGYLGQRLARRFRGDKREVSVITRSQSNHPILESLGCKCITRDITHPAFSLGKISYDSVFLCVAPTVDRKKVNYKDTLYRRGCFAVMRELKRIKFSGKFFVVGSTAMLKSLESYPHFGRELIPFKEENLDMKAVSDPNASYKQFELLKEWSAKADFSIYHFISAGHYGPGRHPGKRVMQGLRETLDNPQRWLNLIHIEDLEEAIYQCHEKKWEPGFYLAADENPVQIEKLYNLYAEKLGSDPIIFTKAEKTNPIADNCCIILSEKLKSQGFQFKYTGIIPYIQSLAELT